MARRPSVTVSIAAEISGMARSTLGVSRVRVDTSDGRTSRVGGAIAVGAIGLAGAIAGVALLPTLPLDLVAASGGAAMAAAGTFGARAVHKGALATTQLALERFLDFLEHEPAQLAAPAGKDFMSRVMSFLSDEWWK